MSRYGVSPATWRLAPGSRLGPYVLDRLLATGGMAEVYAAHRPGFQGFTKRVAVKRIRPDLAGDPAFVALFVSEARVSAQLSHPNIVQIVDFGEDRGALYLAMEYVDGLSCSQLLKIVADRNERVPLACVLHIARGVLRGLHYLHTLEDVDGRPFPLVHRDVTPGNILLSRAGSIKLSDFGIVQNREHPPEQRGTPRYMAPEQALGGPIDARSDLFSFGAVLGELLLGRPLFTGDTHEDILLRMWECDLGPLSTAHRVPLRLRQVLKGALAYDPESRFIAAAQMEQAVEEIVDEEELGIGDGEMATWLQAVLEGVTESGIRAVLSPRGTRAGNTHGAARTRTGRSQSARAPSSKPVRKEPRSFLLATGADRRSIPWVLGELASGHLEWTTPISEKSAQFRPIAEVPPFSRLRNQAAFSILQPQGRPVGWMETVRRAELPLVLYGLARRRETGLLEVRSGRHRKRVYFVDGSPRFVVSTDAAELIGKRLVRSGLVESRHVEAALALAAASGRRVGEALVALGHATGEQITDQLNRQLSERFVDLGHWSGGTASFARGVQAETEVLASAADGLEMVTLALNEGYDDVEVAALLSAFHNTPLVWRQRLEQLAELGLSPVQELVIERAGGADSVDALVAELRQEGVAVSEVLRAVFIGLSSGVLLAPGYPGSMPETGTIGPNSLDSEAPTAIQLSERFLSGTSTSPSNSS